MEYTQRVHLLLYLRNRNGPELLYTCSTPVMERLVNGSGFRSHRDITPGLSVASASVHCGFAHFLFAHFLDFVTGTID